MAAVGGVCPAQELSTTVLPSEDELTEALLNGGIDSVQFEILLDILENGIDSTNRYLLDEIPNLFDIGLSGGSFIPSLETEQEEPFKKKRTGCSKKIGVANYRFYQDLDEDERTKYLSAVTFDWNRQWRLALKIDRELGGQERFAQRTVGYQNNQRVVRKFILGNYTARFGLGTIYGFHRRLLDSEKGLEMESFLFPDNSAMNGGLAELCILGLDISALAAFDRDTAFTMTSFGTMLKYTRGNISLSSIIGLNRLRKRDGGTFIDDDKIGLFTSYGYSGGYTAGEVSGGVGDGDDGWAVVLEGRHHFGSAELRYSGWRYADNYRDLTAGSRSAGIRRTRTIDALDFEYSDSGPAKKGCFSKPLPVLGLEWNFIIPCWRRGSARTLRMSISSPA
ncbi:MAG: hypothetical protein ACOYVF_06480 [Candidatus Zixiibacteriota bacterium]